MLLENELQIRLSFPFLQANEREKQYLTNAPSRKDLEETIRRLQDKQRKAKRLEETCVQQEKVIQKMEKLLNKYMKAPAASAFTGAGLSATAPPPGSITVLHRV